MYHVSGGVKQKRSTLWFSRVHSAGHTYPLFKSETLEEMRVGERRLPAELRFLNGAPLNSLRSFDLQTRRRWTSSGASIFKRGAVRLPAELRFPNEAPLNVWPT